MTTTESSQDPSPFKISISESQLTNLQRKLELSNLPAELDDAGWEYGVPLSEIRRLLSHWKGSYNWRKFEEELNQELPQFVARLDVDGFDTLDIHYVHRKSTVVTAIPLLFVHGWPGSFIEVRKILPLLIADSVDHPSFHVVALSLPGFGFSDAPTKKGFGLRQYAEVANKLMLKLGYNEYVTQGGDWGFYITRTIAIDYGEEHSKAWHTNYPRSSSPPHPLYNPLRYLNHLFTSYTTAEQAWMSRTAWFRERGRGYLELQSTQPQTIGYGITDSPVGLLAWVYEKLYLWSDSDTYKWSDDEVLTWISIYWFSSAGPAASMRIYHEVAQSGNRDAKGNSKGIKIPVGLSFFPKEIQVPPRRAIAFNNIVLIADHSKEGGGHFAAYEKPELLVGDLRKMFGRGGGAFGVIAGKSGYR